jgi:Domain of unknown function (DUF5710)
MPDVIYLDVPYSQKDDAKGLGARWDPKMRRWYITGNDDFLLFRKWWQKTESAAQKPKKPKKSKRSLKVTVGKDYRPFHCDCGKPPWEDCCKM